MLSGRTRAIQKIRAEGFANKARQDRHRLRDEAGAAREDLAQAFENRKREKAERKDVAGPGKKTQKAEIPSTFCFGPWGAVLGSSRGGQTGFRTRRPYLKGSYRKGDLIPGRAT